MKKLYFRLFIYIFFLVSIFTVSYINIDPVLFMLVKSKSNLIPKIFLYLGKDPNLKSKNNNTLLAQSCFFNNYDMVEFLIKKGADPNIYVQEKFIPVAIAAQQKSYDIVKYLIENGADINLKIAEKESCLLSIVVQNGDLEMVKYLIDKGADVNQYDKKCYTPVSVASYNNKTEILQYLLENGGRKRDIKKKYPAIVQAGSEGNEKLIRKLLREGKNINEVNYDGRSAIYIASWNRKIDAVKTLIEYNADVNLRDKDGITPLMKSCEEGDLEIVKLLVESGANLNIRSETGKTALMYAVQEYNKEIIKLLLMHGADPKSVSKTGRSAYSYVRNDSIDIKELLRDKNNVIVFNEDVFSNENEDFKYDWLYPYPSGYSLDAICKIPDTDFIIAGGENGSLLMYDQKTGKLSSNKELFGIDENINDIHFTDKLNGYALLSSEKLIVTKDGGKSWKVGCININGNATKLYFHGKTGFIIGNNYTILRLDVKTDKWMLVNEEVSDKVQRELYIRDIYINDKGFGLAVGVKGMIITTNDFGMTWRTFDGIKTERDFVKIAFPDSNNGYIICTKDVMYSSSDGGKSWNSGFNEDDKYKATYVEQQFYNMIFVDSRTGYLRTNSGIKKTIDKGKSWANTELKNLPAHLVLEKEDMFSIERHNIITSKDMGVTWSSVNKEVMDGFIKVYYCSRNKIYGSVDNRRLLFSNNGGVSWEHKDVEKFLDIFYVDSLNAFMIYSDNMEQFSQIYRYGNENGNIKVHLFINSSKDGGKTWSKLNSDLNSIVDNTIIHNLKSHYGQTKLMYFYDTKIGFIYSNGVILKTDDGGLTWKKDDTNTVWSNFTNEKNITLTRSMHFINEQTGFRTDENGGIYKTDNGCKKWRLVFKSNKVFNGNDHIVFNSINFTNEKNGFAVGDFESICKTTDGGETWKLVKNTEYSNDYEQIFFADKKNGVIAGDDFLITPNGGLSWEKMWINNLSFYDMNSLYFNGNSEIILSDEQKGIIKILWNKNDE